jgi:hypothetical protein
MPASGNRKIVAGLKEFGATFLSSVVPQLFHLHHFAPDGLVRYSSIDVRTAQRRPGLGKGKNLVARPLSNLVNLIPDTSTS